MKLADLTAAKALPLFLHYLALRSSAARDSFKPGDTPMDKKLYLSPTMRVKTFCWQPGGYYAK